MDRVRQDLVHGLRVLLRHRGFSLPALLTLSLGIGAATAVFSIAYGVLGRPLPFTESHRVVRVSEFQPGAASAARDAVISNLTFDAWRQAARAVEELAAYGERAYTVTSAGDAERVRAAAVSPELFRVLDVAPAAGRFFNTHEALQGGDQVVVLGYGFWQRRYGGRADALGDTITLDTRPHTIVGIAPPGFSFPDAARELYTPFVVPGTRTADGAPRVRVFPAIARLAPDATADQAAAEGTAVLRQIGRPVEAELIVGQGADPVVRARPMVGEVTARVRPLLLLLSVGVSLLLFVSGANVAHLLLFRAAERRREFAIRIAIGAGRGRLLHQMLTESLLLAAAGGVIGTVLAYWLVALWPAVAPQDFPRVADVRIDETVLGFAAMATLVAGLLGGLAPALGPMSTSVTSWLREGSGASASRRAATVRRGLLIVETALAVVLVIGAALLTRSVAGLLATDTGYDASRVLSARVSLQGGAITPERWHQLSAGILARLNAMSAVESAGAASMAPLGDSTFMVGFRMPGNGPEPVIARALGYVVTPGYAETLRLRLRQGRLLSSADVPGTPQAMVVNELFAATYLNDGRPILGRQFEGLLAPGLTTEIVGLVGNVLKNGLIDTPLPEIYVALGHHGLLTLGRDINLVVRTAGDPAALAGSLRAIVRDLDHQAPVHNVTPLAASLSSTIGEPRLVMLLLLVCAGLAAGLAAVGLYGALSYWVLCRRRELGVRAALGATRPSLIRLVLAEGMGVTAAGSAVGLLCAAAAIQWAKGLVFGVESFDPLSFVVAPSLLAVIALIACLVPAWRAGAVDPREALRPE